METETETITAKARKIAFATSKLTSLAMEITDNGKWFDAKAFQRSPNAMRLLAAASVNDEFTLVGHWEANPRNGYTTFIVDTVVTDTEQVVVCWNGTKCPTDDELIWLSGPEDNKVTMRFGDMTDAQRYVATLGMKPPSMV